MLRNCRFLGARFLDVLSHRLYDENDLSVVITPAFDALHKNHFHLDLAQVPTTSPPQASNETQSAGETLPLPPTLESSLRTDLPPHAERAPILGIIDGGGDEKGEGGCWTEPFWYFLGVTRSAFAREASVARTIRFPSALRDRITVDAERCGRSFEAQVIALLRRHYGEDVDIAPNPADILALVTASLAGVQDADLRSVVHKLKSPER